ncbi:cytochrome c biogenesis protein [Bacillus sp. PS06]|uniref:cytochrome c biogenesis protein n=1 Tax=Bacillus sp. PS06 TaxID=2764176 RepID=UPI00177DA16D|nr:cytochrome c biogenesis protein CcsA [Bacillus sp. PS06]MBD8068869.1 cytochrome c biogenesis protein CcsA [Bacillus sp. PS06]
MEMNLTRLHELTVILYAICVLLYFIDFLHNNRKANTAAFWLLAFVWLLQTAFLVFRIIETGRFPILSLIEGLYFFAWVLVSLSLIINRLLRVDFTVFFTNIIGFSVMAIHTFAPNQHGGSAVESGQLVSELLMIHITMAILSYGAFSLSFVFSMLYLIQYNLLKKKKWGKLLLRLEDLSKLDHMSYVLNVIGVPMLLLSLLLGVLWAYISINTLPWYDVKVLGSFMVLLAYSFYIYKKVVIGLQGKSIALLNIGSFLILLINFFLFGSLSRFHFWNL